MKLRRSTPDNILPGLSEERFLRMARQYVESAFPNPDRVGCPARTRLETLARHQLRQEQELKDIDHVVHCSNCFIEYQSIRRALKRQRTALVGMVGGAVVAALVTLGIFLSHRTSPIPATPTKGLSAGLVRGDTFSASIDMRPFDPDRGASPKENRALGKPITLHRANLTLTLLLPVGSEDGRYLVRILDPQGSLRIEASGDASIRDYVTTLVVPIDLRSLSSGRFTLTVQRVRGPAPTSCQVELQ
jgi:hypothetical protein